ncbi:MAG: sialate O-acetylesterase [Pirellulales bacterium]|nr:sialate O-acetylesterase [Pirellulales bacterium]
MLAVSTKHFSKILARARLFVWSWVMLAAGGCLCHCQRATAEVQAHALFTDHAVLQRDLPLSIWGTADDGEKVTVHLGDQTAETTAQNGKWSVKLQPLPAGGPHELRISGPKNELKFSDILIGDVWICGGQSNMQWSINQCETPDKVKASANLPQLRFVQIPRTGNPQPQSTVKAKWQVSTPDSVGDLTAVGFHFGKKLHEELHVPIGLINSNIGGTAAQRWTSKETLAANPALARYAQENNSSDLYNAMIHPLAPFGIKGAIWYQGESNADNAYHYRDLFPAMIKNWRDLWGQGEFPFLFVQLAPFMQKNSEPIESNWAELREAQLMTLSKLPHTGMAVITDLGDEKDIHPVPKGPVGERLAQIARNVAYGEKSEPSGPLFDSLTIEGNKAILKFKHVGQGLEARGGELSGFTIAGEDKKFHNATAKVEGDTVVVTADAVTKPVAVRYGWANYPQVNLWNKDGLPASPFRTDDFPGLTQPK